MRGLLRICLLLYLLVWARPTSVAATIADFRNVFVFMPGPEYPFEVRRSRIEGQVLMRLHLDVRGVVTTVTIIKSSGNKALDAAGMEALQHWRAKPGRSGRFYDIPVNFTLKPYNSPRGLYDGLGAGRSSDVGK